MHRASYLGACHSDLAFFLAARPDGGAVVTRPLRRTSPLQQVFAVAGNNVENA
jgi:hypothetical protein